MIHEQFDEWLSDADIPNPNETTVEAVSGKQLALRCLLAAAATGERDIFKDRCNMRYRHILLGERCNQLEKNVKKLRMEV
jgi:hypothetical protein